MIYTMRLFIQRGIFYVEVEGKRRSLKTRDKATAKRLFGLIKRDYLQGKVHMLSGRSNKTLREYADEFLKWAESTQPHPTFRANRLALDKLMHVAGEKIGLDRISVKHVDMMVAEHKRRGIKTASINNYIRHAKASMNKAVEWRYLTANPLAGAKELKGQKKPPAFLTRAEVGFFLKSIEDVDKRRMITAYLSTGRRRAELLELEWKDVALDKNRYFVRRAKNHLSKWYPINSMFRAVLDSIGENEGRVFRRWSHPDTISHIVKREMLRAGFGHLRLHDLRHTFATLKVQDGVDLRTIQELLGHTEYRTTEIYAHVNDDHLSESAEINFGPVDLGKK